MYVCSPVMCANIGAIIMYQLSVGLNLNLHLLRFLLLLLRLLPRLLLLQQVSNFHFMNYHPASMVQTFTLQDPSQLRLWSPKFPPVESQLRMSQGVLETGTLVGLWSDSKSGFSETKSTDSEP